MKFILLWFFSARILLVVLLEAGGFMLVAFATADWMALLGVVSTSLGSGLGEVTLLAYSTFFDKNVVSTWSSGTGGAGILGASSYAGLTSLGLSPSKSLLIMLVIPALMSFSFWGLLQYPNDDRLLKGKRMNPTVCPVPSGVATSICRPAILEEMQTNKSHMSLKTKLKSIPMLFKFMLPLGGVYLFEYFINQGLFEMIDFHNNNIGLSHSEQYRWLQVLYQVGVFVSRSSVNIIKIHQIWLMCLLQAHAHIYSAVIGSPYKRVRRKLKFGNFYGVSEDKREFSMGITSLADAVGIALAGFISIPVHNLLCQLPRHD
uniref:Battenin n=1 Tax=Timema cristinae TaxID=61476 RepID=A0A7R9DC14_TIMCR|nr:unnamed protein product [Timema cristinae]